MSDLVRAAMRMRPDRIVLGECRGSEVRDVLSALNTGHEGGWGTIHANSATDVPSRLVALGALAGMEEPVVAAQAVSALDAVIHVERHGAHRQVQQIAVLERQGGELRAADALVWNGRKFIRGSGWPRLARRLGFDEQGDVDELGMQGGVTEVGADERVSVGKRLRREAPKEPECLS